MTDILTRLAVLTKMAENGLSPCPICGKEAKIWTDAAQFTGIGAQVVQG